MEGWEAVMRGRKTLVRFCAAAIVVGMVLALAGCGGSATSTGSTGGSATTASSTPLKIALLLPETKTARYETQDKPLF